MRRGSVDAGRRGLGRVQRGGRRSDVGLHGRLPPLLRVAAGRVRPAKLINELPILNWSADKVYLKALAAAGVPVVPTVWVEADCAASHTLDLQRLREEQGWGSGRGVIIKPAVGCSSEGILFMKPSTEAEAKADDAAANAHVRQLLSAGQKRLLVQPFLQAVKSYGEVSAVYIDGAFSHALLKTPSEEDFRVQAEFGGRTRVIESTPEMVAVCDNVLRVLDGVCKRLGTEPVLYARIEMIPSGADGGGTAAGAGGPYYVCEVELLEPELFFQDAADHRLQQRGAGDRDRDGEMAGAGADKDAFEWSHVRFAKGILKRLAPAAGKRAGTGRADE